MSHPLPTSQKGAMEHLGIEGSLFGLTKQSFWPQGKVSAVKSLLGDLPYHGLKGVLLLEVGSSTERAFALLSLQVFFLEARQEIKWLVTACV